LFIISLYSSILIILPPFGFSTLIFSLGFITILLALKIIFPISNYKIRPGKPYSPFGPKPIGIFGEYQAITFPSLLVAL